jgi:flagellin-like protein
LYRELVFSYYQTPIKYLNTLHQIEISEYMKGVSAVIATILMLMIVIALAGMAYMYLIGMFTTRTAKTIDTIDAGCRAGATVNGYYVSIKNLDTTSPLLVSELTARLDGNVVAFNTTTGCSGSTSIGPGVAQNCDIAIAGGTGGTFHKIKITGPANSAEEPANC